MQTTIIVLSYNNLKRTKDCIESIQKYLRPETQLIVVDDGSTDGSAGYIAELSKKTQSASISTILLQTNSGASAARNRAIQQAEGSYILFIDNDTIFLDDVPKVMITKLQRHPASICGMCGILAFDYDYYLHIHSDDMTHDIETIAVPSYCMMVDRKVVDDGVIFDEELSPFGAEDVDFCFHARYKGYKVMTGTDIPLKHFEHGSQMSLRPEYREWMDKSHTRVKQKWQNTVRVESTTQILGMLHQEDRITLTTETEHCKFFDLERGKPTQSSFHRDA